MQFSRFLSLSIILGIASGHQYAEYKYPGSCPKVKYIKDLNFYEIVGFWYRCYSTLNSSSCSNNDGQTVYAYPYDSSGAGVIICCRSAADPTQVICGADVGTGFLSPMSTAGMILYETNGESHSEVVLGTDYKTFVISYSCKPKGSKGRDEHIYVYSRSYENCKALEFEAKRIVQQNDIDWSKAKPVAHGSSIPYTTVPKACRKSQ